MFPGSRKVVLVAGGTGGHIYPGIAVAQELRRRGATDDLLFIGSEEGLEKELVAKAGYKLQLIKARAFTRRISFRSFTAPCLSVLGFFQALTILASFSPSAVISFGGYAALPVVLAAKALGIKVFVHEQNVLPGVANKLSFRLADRVFLSFPESLKYCRGSVVGNPVRAEILRAGRQTGGRKVALVLGGSQGARRLNQAVVSALPQLKNSGWTIVHSIGRRDFPAQSAVQSANYQPVEYIEDMAQALASADLVISRAGATAIAEFTAAGLPMVLVPYPHAAEGHQDLNADAVAQAGAAIKVSDRDFTAEKLLSILSDRSLDLVKMGERARSLAHPEAARLIAEALWN
jgi:UDP-N-acetylglucosamine--N-acetylmuramyl-(pentapeptide) pyrophosphoryl-undecaprenol N-acetylglucosamine transferase